MAKRLSRTQKKFDTSDVQGEGSFVVLNSMTLGEIREVRRLQTDENTDTLEELAELIRRQLVDWNWVDGDGKPLPIDESGINDLLFDEVKAIAELLAGDDAKELKN